MSKCCIESAEAASEREAYMYPGNIRYKQKQQRLPCLPQNHDFSHSLTQTFHIAPISTTNHHSPSVLTPRWSSGPVRPSPAGYVPQNIPRGNGIPPPVVPLDTGRQFDPRQGRSRIPFPVSRFPLSDQASHRTSKYDVLRKDFESFL